MSQCDERRPVAHLNAEPSGANIIDHAWTEQRKQELLDSRVRLTQLLVSSIKASPQPPRVFVGSSATGIYPTTPEPNNIEWSESSPIPTSDEQHAPQPNFAMQLCRRWEDAYNSLDEPKTATTSTSSSSSSEVTDSAPPRSATRLVIVRTPPVLSSRGGMLTQVKLPFQLGLGGTLGSGRQLFPWIHIDDWTAFVELAIKNENVRGTFNLVAPEIADNAQFTKALASGTSLARSLTRPCYTSHSRSIDVPVTAALWRPSFFFVPSFMIRLAYGERAPLLLEGAHIRSERLADTGFTFAHPAIHEAMAHLFTNNV